jgi:hypothetical protein
MDVYRENTFRKCILFYLNQYMTIGECDSF